MYVANVEEDGFENNALLEEVKAVGAEEKSSGGRSMRQD